MFEKEKYTKEEFEALEKQANEARIIANQSPGKTAPTGRTYVEHQFGGGFTIRNAHKNVPSPEQELLWKLTDKLEKMKAAGHKEALELEAEHNRLIRDVEIAHAALETFETEQLGLDQQSPDSK